MTKRLLAGIPFLLCAASAGALAAGNSQPETFFIRATPSGREATIKVPVGAVSSFFATRAEALTNYAGPEVEAMRLSGDVRIDVIGNGEPIEIKADRVVLELTADDADGQKASTPTSGARHLRSSRIIEDGDAMQTFVGNVIYTLQTSSGAMQITADRVEHTGRAAERAQRREGV
ncbi:MAG TPA: hypothetical protein VHY75_05205 [Steroidobacteraceae bacterium]|jgi:hypothetical protein|nr:hypothetical protein [Steroidobacteraceae bacterium]